MKQLWLGHLSTFPRDSAWNLRNNGTDCTYDTKKQQFLDKIVDKVHNMAVTTRFNCQCQKNYVQHILMEASTLSTKVLQVKQRQQDYWQNFDKQTKAFILKWQAKLENLEAHWLSPWRIGWILHPFHLSTAGCYTSWASSMGQTIWNLPPVYFDEDSPGNNKQ